MTPIPTHARARSAAPLAGRLTQALLFIATAAAPLRAADPPAPAEKLTPASNKLLEEVQAELSKIRSLEADFTELMTPRKGKTREFTGHLAAREPDHVVWIVRTPKPTAVRVLGEDLRVWTSEVVDGNGKVIAKADLRTQNLAGNPTYKSMAEQTRDWAGGNFKKLAESYDVFVEQPEPALALRFVPKPRTGLTGIFTSASVTLTDHYKSIQKIVYRKTNGETYELTLHNTKINQEIPPDVWKIPPKQ